MPDIPFHRPPTPDGEPIMATLGDGTPPPVVVDGAVIATVVLPDGVPELGVAPGDSALAFLFNRGEMPAQPILLIGTDDQYEFLAKVMVDAVDAAKRARGWQPAPGVSCPGCGVRLFGDVARRGGCLSCFPDLPTGATDAA